MAAPQREPGPPYAELVATRAQALLVAVQQFLEAAEAVASCHVLSADWQEWYADVVLACNSGHLLWSALLPLIETHPAPGPYHATPEERRCRPPGCPS